MVLMTYITSFVCAAVFLVYWSAITPSNLCRGLEFNLVRCSIQKSVYIIHLSVRVQLGIRIYADQGELPVRTARRHSFSRTCNLS